MISQAFSRLGFEVIHAVNEVDGPKTKALTNVVDTFYDDWMKDCWAQPQQLPPGFKVKCCEILLPVSWIKRITIFACHFHNCESIFMKLFFLVSTGLGGILQKWNFSAKPKFFEKINTILTKNCTLFMLATSTIVNSFSWKYFSWHQQAWGVSVKVDFFC